MNRQVAFAGNAKNVSEIRTQSEGRFGVSAAGKRGGSPFLIASPATA
jgi:hypothetical protein